MQAVEEVSAAIGMVLGIRKCAVAHMVRGRLVEKGPPRLQTGESIPEIDARKHTNTWAWSSR